MTPCEFSMRLAGDEMRHVIGSSEPDVSIGSDKKIRTGCAERRPRITLISCASCMKRKCRAVPASCMS